MKLSEVRKKYLEFYKKKGHVIVPSGILVPENDSTTLFTGSGMQPQIPFLLGEKHPEGNKITNSQKCFRTEDIEEVGDNRHTTFFEMLGNWSFGDYFKREQLVWLFEFLVDEIGLDPEKIYVTCFIGDKSNDIPQDFESAEIWKELFIKKGVNDVGIVELGTEAQGYKKGMQGGRIFYYGATKNWWSRSGKPDQMPQGEPGGPDSEIFYDFGSEHDTSWGKHCHPNCDCGRFMEIGNSVFMEYVKNENGVFDLLPQKNVDFGGGLERITAASNNDANMYNIDVLKNIIINIEEISGILSKKEKFKFRVIADHMRGAVHMILDGVIPSNKEQGYILRRLLRRAIFYATKIGFKQGDICKLIPNIIDYYADIYPKILKNKENIINEIRNEEDKFHTTLVNGLKKLEKMLSVDGNISGKDAFILFTTYGFPLEMTLEVVEEKGLVVDRNIYNYEFEKHRELSRTASSGKFKGGLADSSEQTTALHTCTHLMLAGLKKELGDDIHQVGSNITAERTRFDFTYGKKVERNILNKVETYVNNAIQNSAKVTLLKMTKEEAKNIGVEGSFWDKYPDTVNIYSVEDEKGNVYSRELCGGPHLNDLSNIKEKTFKILKEKSSSAGVRRIKAVLQ